MHIMDRTLIPFSDLKTYFASAKIRKIYCSKVFVSVVNDSFCEKWSPHAHVMICLFEIDFSNVRSILILF